jgi:hypothetical protein
MQFPKFYLRAMTPRLAASAAIFRAFDFTSATRRLQPRPKTGQVLSDWRKCSRSSQIVAIKVLGSIARAAATTSSVTTLVLSGSLSVRRRTLPLRPMPEFTPYLRVDRMGIAIQIIEARGEERFEQSWPHDNATMLGPAIEHNAPTLGYQRDL